MGRGEAAGRWVGSLADELGLVGEVGEAEFRRVLDGRDPHTGELSRHRGGFGGRAAQRRGGTAERARGARCTVIVYVAAARLRVSPQYVRRRCRRRTYPAGAAKGSGPTVGPPRVLAGRAETVGRWLGTCGESGRWSSTFSAASVRSVGAPATT